MCLRAIFELCGIVGKKTRDLNDLWKRTEFGEFGALGVLGGGSARPVADETDGMRLVASRTTRNAIYLSGRGKRWRQTRGLETDRLESITVCKHMY